MRSELWRLGFVVSHPCAKKPAQGWGTQLLRAGKGGEAGPSIPLRSAQDDSLFWSARERSGSR
jgi:hypothetical protein